MTEQQRREARSRLFAAGYTVVGWARAHGFPEGTVKNVLYRDSRNQGPASRAIVEALEKEGMIA